MHEFAAAKKIVDILKKEQPKKAEILLGRMVSSKNVFLSILQEHLKGTGLEGTVLEIKELPVFARCACGFEGNIDIPHHVHFVRCPKCAKIADVLEGDKAEIKSIVY